MSYLAYNSPVGPLTLFEEDGFPRLEPLRVGLFYKHPRLSAAGLQLVSDLVARLDRVGPEIDGLPS